MTQPIKTLLKVRFEKVSFTYPNGQVALQNISFSITQGEKIAFVGNGAGKSTIKITVWVLPAGFGKSISMIRLSVP